MKAIANAITTHVEEKEKDAAEAGTLAGTTNRGDGLMRAVSLQVKLPLREGGRSRAGARLRPGAHVQVKACGICGSDLRLRSTGPT